MSIKSVNLIFLSSLASLLLCSNATAQITPDNTLGKENSQIRSGKINGIPSTIIEKGARRGANIFHSFSQFNIPEAQGAYFTNPTGVKNIFSRVTGTTPSNLLGTLGVLGNANLFFINPNGIVFGPNAKLDIKGVFTASTADSIVFDNNFEFSASDPQVPPLLTVNIPVGLSIRDNSMDIAIQGKLATENNLNLSANNLYVSGSISTDGNLEFEAQKFLTIEDSQSVSTIITAGKDLLIQGNQDINISLVNHPDSLIVAGKSLTLSSAAPIAAQGYFWSGGNFKVETAGNSLGDFVNPSAVTIYSLGDVSINSYQGKSLQIIAGGSINIPDSIWITGVNPNFPPAETVKLSDGQEIKSKGRTENTLDLRAGVSPDLIKNLAVQRNIGLPSIDSLETPKSADITIGTTVFRSLDFSQQLGGKVLLTNQYEFNGKLVGNVTVNDTYTQVGAIDTTSPKPGAAIAIDSRDKVNIAGRVINSLAPSEQNKPGKITVNSLGDLSIAGELWNFGGDIDIESKGKIELDGGLRTGYSLLDSQGEIIRTPIDGGTLSVNSQGDMTLTGTLGTQSNKRGGDIILQSGGDLLLEGASLNTQAAPGGKIKIRAENLTLKAKDESNPQESRTFLNAGIGIGLISPSEKAGEIDIKVEDQVQLGQLSLVSNDLFNESQGDGGNINIEGKFIGIKEGSQVTTTNQGRGKIGDIFLKGDRIVVNGSANVVVDGQSVNLISRIYSNAFEIKQGDSGNIAIDTKTLEITGGADVSVENFVRGKGNGGNITINARDSVLVAGEGKGELNGFPIFFGSQIATNLGRQANGKSGIIEITTDSLKVAGGARISASVFGKGQGGKIAINANSVLVTGEKSDGFASLIDSSLQRGEGKGGDIEINSNSLAVKKGAQISASSFALGNGGQITINTKSFELSGETRLGQPSIIGTGIGEKAIGEGGKIQINADKINILQGAQLQSITEGYGNAGEIQLNAGEINLSGATSIDATAGISTQVGPKAKGNAGTVNIKADSLNIDGSAGIDSVTFSRGNAGSILLEVGSLKLDSGEIASSVEKGAKGKGGAVIIDSNNLEMRNVSLISVSNAGIGRGGDIFINSDSLKVLTGSQIQAATFSGGKGNGGNITINTPQLTISGEDTGENTFSLITTAVDSNAIGNAGNIVIDSDSLTITGGGQIQASMLGEGNAGSVNIQANNINLDGEASNGIGSGIVSSLTKKAKGEGGELNISADTLTLTNGGFIGASTSGEGDGGSIKVKAQTINLEGRTKNQEDGSSISSDVRKTGEGNAGSIAITADTITLKNGGEVTTNTEGKGSAGMITIDAGLLSLEDGKISSAVQETGKAKQPSTIEITAGNLNLGDKSEITASTSGKGNAGEIKINTSEVNLEPQATISAFTGGDGDGGNIEINAPQGVNLGANSNLTVETSSPGKAGNIIITSNTITIGENAQLSATATKDSTNTEGGGSITLNTANLNISGQLGIFAETQGQAPAGNLSLKPNKGNNSLNINFTGDGFISARTTAEGQGGSIDLSADQDIAIRGEGRITAETSGKGNAGSINITGKELTFAQGVEITASTTGEGKAGQINITGDRLQLKDNAQIQTNTNSGGQAGDINLTIANTLQLNNSSILATTSENSTGDGGNITIDPIKVSLRNNAQIAVDSQGQGNGGSISLTSGELRVKDNSTISATTASGEGGNITLNIDNLTILDNNSPLIAEAGGTGNGGNITLDTQFLVAGNNSDINANAFEGRGGNINITAQGIFLDRDSTITASSQFGVDGIVSINTPAIDPTKGILNFSSDVVDAADLIGRNLCQASFNSKFVVTGKGGIPTTPHQQLDDNGVEVDLAEPVFSPEPPNLPQGKEERRNGQNKSGLRSRDIVPAKGWIFNELGQAVLVGYDPTKIPIAEEQNSSTPAYVCQ